MGLTNEIGAYVDAQPNERHVARRAAFIARLRQAADKLGFLAKDARNEHFGYDYASEASVKRAVRAALAECGLAVVGVRTQLGMNSTPTCATVWVAVDIGDESGERAGFEGVAGDQDKSGKAVMKAEAGAFKYALLQGFAIPTGDDPEANREADAMGAAAKAETKPARGKRAAKAAPAGGDEW